MKDKEVKHATTIIPLKQNGKVTCYEAVCSCDENYPLQFRTLEEAQGGVTAHLNWVRTSGI